MLERGEIMGNKDESNGVASALQPFTYSYQGRFVLQLPENLQVPCPGIISIKSDLIYL